MRALEVPAMLFAYALPISLAVPLWFALPVRQVMDETGRRIGASLAAAVLIGWGVGLFSGMVNPRVRLPDAAGPVPLAGAGGGGGLANRGQGRRLAPGAGRRVGGDGWPGRRWHWR